MKDEENIMIYKDTYKQLLKTVPKSKRSNIRIIVGLSGGVDSAYTAYKLLDAGFSVKGIYMHCFENNDPACKSKIDREDAIKVATFLAKKFNFTFDVWDFRKEYEKQVISYFIDGYKKGETPNADILCNNQIKFGLFLKKAIENEKCNYVATGHYARILKEDNEYFIANGKDLKKDQSYFLSTVEKKVLEKILFPLGALKKSQNRLKAKILKIPVSSKKDSTGVCFLQGADPFKLLKTHIKEKQGHVLSTSQSVIGSHMGAQFFTIGQRHGFQLNKYQGVPMYVVKKDVKNNTITVGEEKDLYSCILNFKRNESHKSYETHETDLYLRIRNLGEFYKIRKLIQKNKNIVQVETIKKIRAISAGQFAVIYKKLNKTDKIIVSVGEIT